MNYQQEYWSLLKYRLPQRESCRWVTRWRAGMGIKVLFLRFSQKRTCPFFLMDSTTFPLVVYLPTREGFPLYQETKASFSFCVFIPISPRKAEMFFWVDEKRVEMLLNPLGVPSRMNV